MKKTISIPSTKTLLKKTSILVFHPLLFSKRADTNGNYRVIRRDTDTGLILDKTTFSILRGLRKKLPLAMVARRHNCTIAEIYDNIHMFIDQGFIKSIDKKNLPDIQPKIRPWLVGVSRKWFRWVLSPIFYMLFFPFTIVGLCLVFTNPHLIPSYHNFFWTTDGFLVFISLEIVLFITTFIHEGAHFITTKAIGGEARITFSHRFIYFIAQTDNYHISKATKKERYIVYASGMIVDCFIIACINWTLVFAAPIFSPGLWQNFLLSILAVEYLGIIWEFNFFLETDVYNIISDMFDEENLFVDIKKYLSLHIKKWNTWYTKSIKQFVLKLLIDQDVLNQANDLRFLTKKRRIFYKRYMTIFVIGIITTSLAYLYIIIPRDITFVFLIIHQFIISSNSHDYLSIIKFLVTLFLLLYQYIFVFSMITKKIIRQKSIF